jgi:hypothetical protein
MTFYILYNIIRRDTYNIINYFKYKLNINII